MEKEKNAERKKEKTKKTSQIQVNNPKIGLLANSFFHNVQVSHSLFNGNFRKLVKFFRKKDQN